MSDRDPDDESTEDLWDELDEFSEADPEEVEEFVEVEEVTDVESAARSTAENGVDEPDSTPVEDGTADTDDTPAVDEEVLNTDDTPAVDEEVPNTDDTPAVDEEVPNTDDAPDADEVFDEMDVSAVDGEALWDELAGAETEADSFEASETAGPADAEVGGPVDREADEPSVGPSGEQSTGDSDGGTETLVDKRAYCQQCPYFSAPPEVGCSHDGTEIVEVLTDGRFRVQSCPVVTDTGPDRTILNDGP